MASGGNKSQKSGKQNKGQKGGKQDKSQKSGKGGKQDKSQKNQKKSTKSQNKKKITIIIGVIILLIIAMGIYSSMKGAQFIAANPQLLALAAA